MTNSTMHTPHVKHRSPRRRSRRSLSLPPEAPLRSVDAEDYAIGEMYLDLYDPPALASTTATYMQMYAVVRAILEGESIPHAQIAAQAARDAAAQHIERRMSGGGQSP